MKFIANGPKRDVADVLVWRGRWDGLPWVLVSLGPLIVVGSLLSGAGPPWVSFLVFAVGLGLFFGGPMRSVAFDMRQREIRVQLEGLLTRGNEKVIRFDEVRDLLVIDRAQKPRELVIRISEGELDLIGLGRTYANEQALGELRAALPTLPTPRPAPT